MKHPSEIELNEYAEDRLATARRWEIARHLEECPDCRTELDGLSWATAALAGLDEAALEEASHPSLEDLAALREGGLPAARRGDVLAHLGACPECAHIYGSLPREHRAMPLTRHWQPFAAAAAVLLVIGLVFLVNREGQISQPGPGLPQARVAEERAPGTERAPATEGAPGGGVRPIGPKAGDRLTSAPPQPVRETGGPRRVTRGQRKRGGYVVAVDHPDRGRPVVRIAADEGGVGRSGRWIVGLDGGTPPAAPAAPSPADTMVPFGVGAGGVGMAREEQHQAILSDMLLCQNVKPAPPPAPVEPAPAMAVPGMPGGPGAATAPGGGMAATGMAPAGIETKSVAPPPPTINRLRAAWLVLSRNEPTRKAAIKAGR